MSLNPLGWLTTGIAIVAGTAGCNALTNYHDRDIDAVMMRTRHRPLPSGRITPRAALRFGLGLISISLILAALLNFFSLLWMALGILDNVGVYSLLLKRRSSLNILLGGFSGGLPVLFGWSAVTAGPVGSLPNPIFPLLMAGLVFVWIPVGGRWVPHHQHRLSQPEQPPQIQLDERCHHDGRELYKLSG